MRPRRAGWLGAALAGALAVGGATAAVPLAGAVRPPDNGAAERGQPHRKGGCDRLDAASIPACADRMPPAAAPPKPAVKAPPAAGPAAPPPRAAAKPAPPATPTATATARAAKARAAVRGARKPAAAPAEPWQRVIDAVHRQPILAGAAGGVLVLLLGGGVWAVARGLRRRPRAPSAAAPRATPPTAFRRDVVLKDEAGRDWRAAGSALTPGVVAGSGAESQLRLAGDGVAPRHVMLWVCDGRLLARQLAEPVFLNDRRLKDATPEIVSTGDRLRLGRAEFAIMID